MLNSQKKGPGRPPNKNKEAKEIDFASEIVDKQIPSFVNRIEKYLLYGKLTKEQLMSLIGVGETQLYRWARGDSMPRKHTVNRIASAIALRIDSEYGDQFDPYPGTDNLDGILNELLKASGFTASINGYTNDNVFNTVAKNRICRVGYMELQGFADIPSRKTSKPTGIAIEETNKVLQAIGLTPDFYKVEFHAAIAALRNGDIDLIAPTIDNLPMRQFDLALSQPLNNLRSKISTLIIKPIASENLLTFEDLAPGRTKLFYLENEMGDISKSLFGEDYKYASDNIELKNLAVIVSTMNAMIQEESKITPVLVINSNSALELCEIEEEGREKKYKGSTNFIQLNNSTNISAQHVFACHPDETKFMNVINSAINASRTN